MDILLILSAIIAIALTIVTSNSRNPSNRTTAPTPMKTQLLKELRRDFAILQRGNQFSYKRLFTYWDTTAVCQSDWSNDKSAVLSARRDDLLKFARINYTKPKK